MCMGSIVILFCPLSAWVLVPQKLQVSSATPPMVQQDMVNRPTGVLAST